MDRRRLRTPILARIQRLGIMVDEVGCWIFQGADNGIGYGVVGSGGRESRNLYVHRVVFEAHRGPIPDGLVLDHLCRKPRCCNPEHLEPVTQRVNVLRGTGFSARAAAATECPRGHPYDPENTYTNPNDGSRQCRECARAYQRRRRIQIREKAAA